MTIYELKIVSKPYSLGYRYLNKALGGRKLIYKTSKLMGTKPILPIFNKLPKKLKFKFLFKEIYFVDTIVFWNPFKELLPKNIRHKDYGKKDTPFSNRWYKCRSNFTSQLDRIIDSKVTDNKLISCLNKETNCFIIKN